MLTRASEDLKEFQVVAVPDAVEECEYIRLNLGGRCAVEIVRNGGISFVVCRPHFGRWTLNNMRCCFIWAPTTRAGMSGAVGSESISVDLSVMNGRIVGH